jgi:hypothetical protein
MNRLPSSPMVVMSLAMGVLAAPLPSGSQLPGFGPSVARAEGGMAVLPSQMGKMQRACRWVWNRATNALSCVNPGTAILGFGPAGALAGAMGPRGSVPHEWYPYRNREEAMRAYGGMPLGVHGPLMPPPPLRLPARPPRVFGPIAPPHMQAPPVMRAAPPRTYPVPHYPMPRAVYPVPQPRYPVPQVPRHNGPLH